MKKSYAVITGASSGIGMAFARQLAAEGYRLVLVARRENRLQALAEELNKSGTESMIITADLSEKEACYRLMQQLEPVPVGILINNAGFGDCGSFLETDADKEMQMIDVNVKAMHLLMKLMLRRMEKRLHFKCRFFGRTASGRPVYGHLLCDQSLYGESDAGSGARTETERQPGICRGIVSGSGEYGIQ